MLRRGILGVEMLRRGMLCGEILRREMLDGEMLRRGMLGVEMLRRGMLGDWDAEMRNARWMGCCSTESDAYERLVSGWELGWRMGCTIY